MSELPKGWSAATLEDVAVWSSGGTPSRSNPAYYTGAIPWFKTGELGPQVLLDSEEHISEAAVESSSAKIFPRGSVALAMYGATIGKVSIFGIDAATNQACAVGIPNATTAEFLYYFLVSQEKAFADAGKGGAQPNISQGIVKAWPLLLPPRAEQTRIITKLEELLSDLDAGVAELKAAQKKLQQYRQSLLKAAVEGALTASWRETQRTANTPLETGAELLERILRERRARWEEKQLAKFKEQGKTPPRDWQKKYSDPVVPDISDLPELPEGWVWASVEQLGDVQLGRQRSPDKLRGEAPTRYIRAANITESGISLDNVLSMDFSEQEKETFSLREGDVLLTEASGSAEHVGRPAIWRQTEDLYCFQNTVLRFSPQKIESRFSYFWFLAMQKLGVFRKLSGGVGINHLSAGKFSKLAFALPPLLEQTEVLRCLESQFASVSEQEAAIKLSLKQSVAQRQNILRAAFAGQLVPQDPNDEPASVLLERIRSERAAQAAMKKPRGRKTKEVAA